MRVLELEAVRHDGTRVSLCEMARGRPLTLVFLRHLGCIFCREQVATMRDRLPEANIAFVTMSEPARAARFRTWIRSPHVFLSDVDQSLYRAFGLERGSAPNVLGPHVGLRALQAVGKGHLPGRMQKEDPWQLGGTFVIDGDGSVVASFPARDAGDYPSPEVLRNALAK